MSLWETHPLEWTLGLLFFFRFLWYGPLFKSLYWICDNIASVLCFGFLVMRHVGSWLLNQGLNPQSLHWPSREVLGWDYWWFMNRIWQKQWDATSKARLQKYWLLFWDPFLSLSLSLSLSCRSQLPCCEEPHREVHMTKNWFFQPTASKNLRPSVQQPRQWCWKQNSAASADTRLQLLGRPCWKHPPKLHTDSWLTETMI